MTLGLQCLGNQREMLPDILFNDGILLRYVKSTSAGYTVNLYDIVYMLSCAQWGENEFSFINLVFQI